MLIPQENIDNSVNEDLNLPSNSVVVNGELFNLERERDQHGDQR